MDDWKSLLVLLLVSTFGTIDAQQTGNTLKKCFIFKLVVFLFLGVFSARERDDELMTV